VWEYVILYKNVTISEIFMENPIKEVRLNAEEKPTVSGDNTANVQQGENKKKTRTAVNLSVIGLILSVFGGLGVFFSVAGIVCGMLRKNEDATSSSFAILLGTVGTVLGVLFAGMLLVCLIILL